MPSPTLFTVTTGLLLLLMLCCADPAATTPAPPAAAVRYCGNCHLLPEAGELPVRTWREDVLPKMGALYGIYPDDNRQDFLRQAQPAPHLAILYPEAPRIDSADWANIVAYYTDHAPQELPAASAGRSLRSLTQFTSRPAYNTLRPQAPPLTTYIGYDSTDRRIIVGSVGTGKGHLTHYSATRAVESREVTTVPSDVNTGRGYVLELGSFLPSDLPTGRVTSLAGGEVRLDSLLRPTKMRWADLDLDGERELVIGEFGFQSGRLAAYGERPDGQLGRLYTLDDGPGATSLQLADLDADGHEDLIVLFGQGDERIAAYYARAGGPELRVLTRLPASYGSSDLEVADMNGDGAPDLIATNGDNYDYEPVAKPYHGVRIYENDGAGNFAEAYHYPMDGAYNVEVADFNGDGRQDLAAVAYFVPPELRAEYSFVYLQRSSDTSRYAFVAYGLEKSPEDHFMTMTSADVDGDGDRDLLLGNFMTYLPENEQTPDQRGRTLPSFYLLENQYR